MPTYETLVITLPTLTEEEERVTVEGIVQVIADGGGELAANERMGRRRLAFPIRKSEDGVYSRFLYDSESAVAREIDRRLRISDRVLRHITVRMEPDWAAASKEQAVRDAEARAAEEAAREKEAAEEAARLKAEAEAPASGDEPVDAGAASEEAAGGDEASAEADSGSVAS